MKSWKQIQLPPSASIESAIEILNSKGSRIILVAEEDDTLLGVVTDGDIRRGLLKHIPLSEPVSTIMNVSPKYASPNWGTERMLRFMEEHSLFQLPIINEFKQVVRLYTLHDLLKKPVKENPVFIMAGGFGTRLRPLTNSCPKPMLKIGGKPLLETVVENFVKQGFTELYISTHYLPHIIMDYFGDGRDWGANITYVHEETPLGTGGALGLLPSNITAQPLIMVNGDVLTTIDYSSLLEFHTEHRGIATMCVREYEHQIPYGVVEGKNNKIISMEEKPIQRFFVNAGIYVIEPRIYLNTTAGEKIDMPTVLEKNMENKEDVYMYPIHEYWLDIGQMHDFHKAQNDIHTLQLT